MRLENKEESELTALAERLGELLIAHNATVSAAESCTGGWLSQVFTSVAGSSQWFGYGLVTYSNSAKGQLLGVSDELLEQFGAVSQPVVEKMATAVLQLSNSTLSLSVSGIAGPGGGSDYKPVGTVWFGMASTLGRFSAGDKNTLDSTTGRPDAANQHSDEPEVRSECLQFDGGRYQIRKAAVAHALSMLLEAFDQNP